MEDEKVHIQNLSRYQVCVVPQIPVIRENVLNKNIDRKCHIGTPRFPILGFCLGPGWGVFWGWVGGFIPLLLPPPPAHPGDDLRLSNTTGILQNIEICIICILSSSHYVHA